MYDATALQIGRLPQLFVDNLLIEQTDCLTRRWHKPQRLTAEPVIRADRPWENTLYFTYSNFNVLQDPTDGLIKCWYEDIGPITPHRTHPWKNRMLYAVSRNGIDFEKPALGKVTIDGHDTNIYAGYVEGATPDANNPWADVGIHSAAVVIDPTSSDARYRMLFSLAREGQRHQMVCGYSTDGINWHPYGERPTFGTSGGQLSDVSTITFDPETRLFLHYTRHGGMHGAGVPETSPGKSWLEGARFQTYFPGRPDLMNKRRVFRTVSADFLHWADPVAISTPDEVIDNLDTAHYGLSQFRVGAMHLGTLGVFHYVDNEMEVRLLYSHDGIHFRPADNGQPFLAPRRGNAWDRHMVSIISPPVRVGDEWYFYHGGSEAHHDWWWAGPYELDHEEARRPSEHVRFGMGIATLRYEGIASLDAIQPRPGRLVTRPLSFDGKTLSINARVRTNGAIRVGLLDSSGGAISGYGLDDCLPFTGDAIRHAVRWRGQAELPPAKHPGQFRKFVITIDEAEIFGFVVE
ncbi:hypothetical protein VW23_012485 [Devosia insulae DS-56]|uniref:Glycosyl hydrolase family 32 N-terminal domain-containing protein n=1 Tax=Devosia insulae DS-56 TaxID=1116389 RepID=A0A1E5XUJ3_9HYPH|nr:hypothetical protein [Devosia insulae]OEO32252.1 hypothetical protein VW23_012485 [Devosia insulae DS-56]